MTTIQQEDLIQSIADGFQFISFYHPVDFIKTMGEAYEREQSPAAKNAMAQILINSRMAAEGHRPVCQDTGIAVVFLKVGMDVRWDASLSVQDMVNEGVRRAYTDKDNPLRASIVADPAGARRMDKFMDVMLGKTGLLGSIGKSERGVQAVEAIRRHQGVHLIAVGGAAYLVSKAIRASRVLAFQDLGMEAIHEFEVKDMPVTVAVDAGGNSAHDIGPREWRARIGKIPVTTA